MCVIQGVSSNFRLRGVCTDRYTGLVAVAVVKAIAYFNSLPRHRQVLWSNGLACQREALASTSRPGQCFKTPKAGIEPATL